MSSQSSIHSSTEPSHQPTPSKPPVNLASDWKKVAKKDSHKHKLSPSKEGSLPKRRSSEALVHVVSSLTMMSVAAVTPSKGEMSVSSSPQPLATSAPDYGVESSVVARPLPEIIAAKEELEAGVGATAATAEALQWSGLISSALGLSPPKTESESSQLSKCDKRTAIESEVFLRRLVQIEELNKDEEVIDDLRRQLSELSYSANDVIKLRAKNEELKRFKPKAYVRTLESDRQSSCDRVVGLQIDNSGWRACSDHHCTLSGQLARDLEISNMLNHSFLDENRTLSDDVRNLKNQKLSFDDAYYRLSRDRNLLESSLPSQKDVSNDLASKLAKSLKEMDEACQAIDRDLEDLQLFHSANDHPIISNDLHVVISQEKEEVLALKKKLEILQRNLTRAIKEMDSSSRQLSSSFQLVDEVLQERDDLRRDKEELEQGLSRPRASVLHRIG
ncbi:hypothetical protein C5167_036394 [Papaver somniferum]|uniref:Uncharacterized protein n=1 Tax=Papaver somniferum TaxID=3469 RepID=A0A4Y7I3K5_PAPSO|nr:hypothetical protein C5167_036394 [Papaver somniferum]